MSTNELAEPYQLPAGVAARFAEEGFVRLPGVLSAETIARYEPEITGKVIELNTSPPMAERSTYAKAFLQVENLWTHSELVREFTFSRRLAQIAADLLGVEGVRLYHDQALYKESGGGITPWHSDQHYWPVDSDRTCTVWVPLQETPLPMGPLEFAVGSHRDVALAAGLGISDESEARMAGSRYEVRGGGYALGEVSYHLGWTIHHAQPNTTDTPRRVMTIIYLDADIRVAPPANEFQAADLERFLLSAPAGAVPDSDLTPVLYRR